MLYYIIWLAQLFQPVWEKILMTPGRNLVRGSCDVAFHVFKSRQEVGEGGGVQLTSAIDTGVMLCKQVLTIKIILTKSYSVTIHMKPPLQYIHMLPLFYTGSSPSGHFCKQTALLMATLTKPCFSQLPYKLVFLHFHKLTAPVMDIFFFTYWGCLLTRAFTVLCYN